MGVIINHVNPVSIVFLDGVHVAFQIFIIIIVLSLSIRWVK